MGEVTVGSDQNVWFTDFYGNRIGAISPAGDVRVYPLPDVDGGSQPAGITPGAFGELWVAARNANAIDRFTMGDGGITSFPIPTPASWPQGIARGSDGNIWFTETEVDAIGRLTPADGGITEFALPTQGAAPLGIVAAADGNLWFTELGTGNVGLITPGGAVTEFPQLPGSRRPTSTFCDHDPRGGGRVVHSDQRKQRPRLRQLPVARADLP